MKTHNIQNIVIIGAGNVATHLAIAFQQRKKTVLQIISRSETSAKTLAEKVKCSYSTNINDCNPDADLYLISVTDDSIKEIVNDFPHSNKFMAHTSGSVSMDFLNGITNDYGVFYPLQTFSKNIELDYSKIPFCIEASNENNINILLQLAGEISENTYRINFNQRQILHLAAVFACNFSNHMYSIAYNILKKENITFDILKPLIKETARKIEQTIPKDAQTGPAVRNDEATILKHIEKLKMFEDYQKLYTFMTQSIQKEKKE
jgi:predicted short-subunit dehydrogenase-like oxidoreductase (DUF2520 family)